MPRAIETHDPQYPPGARQARHQGSVLLSFVVDIDGRPKNIQVVKSNKDFDKAAIKTLRTYKFEPGMKDGKPVPVAMKIDIEFHIY
jgi:TonB family protein